MLRSKLFLINGMFLLLVSCGPKIYYFEAEPRAVSSADSIIMRWKIRGKPTMLFDRIWMANPGADSLQLLEFTLVAEKGTKEPAHLKKQVILLPRASRSTLYIRMDSLSASGDSLIAISTNDTMRWQNVYIMSLSNYSGRELVVSHAGRTKELNKGSSDDNNWADLPYGGLWEIKSPLSESEIKDHSLIPARIELQVTIKPGKN
jgi:hypothetical protein